MSLSNHVGRGRFRRFPAPLLLAVTSSLLTPACEKVPLLAPSGSTIVLTAAASALPTNGTTDIIAQILESGGTPPHSGTHVIFTTTLGTIRPSEIDTDVNGRVVVKFLAGAANGSATIIASSGGATTGTTGAVKIAIGTAAVGRVVVNASPATVPAIGGSTTITANVLDVNGNVLSSTPVTFSTTAGSLSAGVVTTDANGVATTTLTTSQAATVTASVGAQAPATSGGSGGSDSGTGGGTTSSGQASGSVTVNISAAPTLVISPPSTPPSAGLPASFTFAVTNVPNGAVARSVTVNWGDGDTQNLGAVSGNAIVSHVFDTPRSYTITATMTDSTGNVTTVSTSVTVIPVPRPTIIVTASPPNPFVNNTVTFTIQVTTPAGIGVQSTSIDFGDGQSDDLGGATSATKTHQYTTAGSKTVTVSVLDTAGTTTTGTTIVTVS